ncbi:DUF817 domain-containing protein [uncultured Gimesia sp.]|jgi:uncharacterized membrane protein YoaT (DUF817 family)|uniref:DUF817 domain-containing protein n=1 Tax=uncultured Gimesia sp. TaxID=1678688 RepID=UPI002614B04A|nr:DUF817 domain-containing protein [uncultured Gimesia sp.]
MTIRFEENNEVPLLKTLLHEFWLFGIKQASACIFGGFLLAMMIITRFWYPFEFLYRYDFLFLAAVAFQIFLLSFRLESPREAVVILIFHFVATVMELFKTSDGIRSWQYPEPFVIGIGNVPLFAGFMYSAVGSYIARVWRIFDFRYSSYPPLWSTVVLVALIYANFFTHHYVFDIRWLLILASLFMFGRVTIYFRMDRVHRSMPLVVGWLLVALFIWFAENLATYSNVWIYPSQKHQWQLVPLSKLTAWYLLMMLSFVLVSLVNRPVLMQGQPALPTEPDTKI